MHGGDGGAGVLGITVYGVVILLLAGRRSVHLTLLMRWDDDLEAYRTVPELSSLYVLFLSRTRFICVSFFLVITKCVFSI